MRSSLSAPQPVSPQSAPLASPAQPLSEAEAVDRLEQLWADPPGFVGWFRSLQNDAVGGRIMVTAFAFFLVGGLLALGITAVSIVRRPRVGILATGDEVIAPAETAAPGQIRDINSYTVAGLVEQAGGVPVMGGIMPDNFAALATAAANLLAETDMLVMSAGSSVSVRDMTVRVIDGLGQPGVLLHGVATRPGKPTIVGAVGHKPVLGLPGNPVSAMIQFDMFGVPAIYRLQGVQTMPRRGLIWARLGQNIASESGREDYVPARLEDSADGLRAIPVFGKSNLIYTLVNADGLIKIPLNKGGLLAGEWVEVRLF